MVNSHIQMPKVILQNFVNEHGQLFVYDFEEKVIRRKYPKSTYTAWGYYSDEAEKFLNVNVENGLGILVKFLRTTSFEIGDEPHRGYEEIAFDYLYSLITRSPSYQGTLCRNSVFFQFAREVNRHDYAACGGLEVARERRILRDFYKIAFMTNSSGEDFVLPIVKIKSSALG